MWDHFDVSASDRSYAVCKHCGMFVSRGGKFSASWTTTTLKNHMLRHHPSINPTATENRRQPEVQSRVCAAAAEPRRRAWDSNDPRSMRLQQLIIRMIAVDDQPFSIIEQAGFRTLMHELAPRYTLPSESYLRQVAVPELCQTLRTKVAAVIEGVPYVSLTVDRWTTSACSESVMCVTGHWLDDDFTRHSAILQTSCLPASHTAADIRTKFIDMVKGWKLSGKVACICAFWNPLCTLCAIKVNKKYFRL